LLPPTIDRIPNNPKPFKVRCGENKEFEAMALNPWDLVVLGVGFFMIGVGFLRDLDFVIEKLRRHQSLLRRLANAKLIGLAILAASVLFGLTTTVQIVTHPEILLGFVPTMALCLLGTELGLELLFPSNQYL